MGRLSVKVLSTLVLAFLAVSCNPRRGVVEIRLVASSDVHGHIFGSDAMDGSLREGSLAKLSSFLKAQRSAHDNVVYVDCGDILQGSVEMYRDVTAEFYKPSLAAQAFNLLDCQAIAMGNHDLQVGTNCYDRFFRPLQCPVLWGNLGFNRPGDYMPPYRVIEVHGVRIAFLGLTTTGVETSIPADVLGEMQVFPFDESLDRWLPILRNDEKADVIVGLVHAKRDEAVSIRGLDLVLYGDDHTPAVFRNVTSDGDSVWFANPGAYSSQVAVAGISMDFSKSDNPEPGISVSLQDLSDVEPDREFMERFSDRWADVCSYCDSIVGYIDSPLSARGVMEGSASALEYIHSVQMDYQGAQISLTSCVQDVPEIAAGAVTVRDVFHLYPYDNSMVALLLSGSEIKSVLEYSVGEFLDGQLVERLLTAAGISYTVDVLKPSGQRVTVHSMSDGSPFLMDKMYRTTVSSFVFGSQESVLKPATGLSGMDLQRRLNVSSQVDIKYYVITQLALCRERGDTVRLKRFTDWSMPPAAVVIPTNNN